MRKYLLLFNLLMAITACNDIQGPQNISNNINTTNVTQSLEEKLNHSKFQRIETGYTITSYGDPNEKHYTEEKIQVWNRSGDSLGYFKKDFLQQVKIDGSGYTEEEKFLHYDYSVNDNKTYYLSDYSRGVWDNPINGWHHSRPSIAINPPLEQGTKIDILELGPNDSPQWVNELLLTKIFYIDDKFFGIGDEKRIDIYIGLLKNKSIINEPESLLIKNATIGILE